jgi:hypothetical protein
MQPYEHWMQSRVCVPETGDCTGEPASICKARVLPELNREADIPLSTKQKLHEQPGPAQCDVLVKNIYICLRSV